VSTILVTGNYVVGLGTTVNISLDSVPAYTLSKPGSVDPNFSVQGTVQITGAGAWGIGDNSNAKYTSSVVNIGNSGSFSVISTSDANGFTAGSGGAAFENDGLFSVSASSQAFGVHDTTFEGGSAQFDNTGTFQVSGATVDGVMAPFLGLFQNSGTFTAAGDSSAYGFLLTANGSQTFSNTGTITVTSNTTDDYGIYLNGGYVQGQAQTITNAGAISAKQAIFSTGPAIDLTNSGAITGNIVLQQGGGGYLDPPPNEAGTQIVNTGSINGNVSLDNIYNDLYDGRGGTLTGTLYVGEVQDTVYLGDDGETVVSSGSGANATITGGAGNDTFVIGAGQYLIDGGAGTNTLSFANTWNGVNFSLGLQGTAQIYGTTTVSHVQNVVGTVLNDILEGGGGASSALTGGGGPDTFVYRPGDGNVTVTDFSDAQGDKIDLSQFFGFATFAQVQAAAVQSGADTVIAMSGGGSLTLQSITLSSLTAADFILPNPAILVAGGVVTTDPTFSLSLTSGSLVQFTAASGGTLVNQGALTLNSSVGATGVSTAASPDSSAVFENDGSFSVTGPLIVTGVANATTHNFGTFSVNSASAIFLAEGTTGDVVNSGTMTVQGGGSAYGVYDSNAGGAGGTFKNQSGGVFSVTSTNGAAYGVVLANGGDFENAGLITVAAATMGIGLAYGPYNGAGPFTNTGTITVTGGSTTGVLYNAPASVSFLNTGTITAQTAIQNSSSASTSITNSGTLNGAVVLGNGAVTLDSHAGTINGVVTLGLGSSTVILGAENNIVDLTAGTHVVDGGGGTNTVSYAGAATGVQVSLALQGQAQSTGVGTDNLGNFQVLVGSTHEDVLSGGISGADTLTGGGGADVFVHAKGSAADTITDFTAGDRIDLAGFGFKSLADVLAVSAQIGSNTVITIGAGSVTLDNVAMNSLTAGDFILPASTSDFGQTGLDGLLFRNGPSGDWGYMSANLSGGETWHPIGPTSPTYAALIRGDFNGDGVIDTAFRQMLTGEWGFMTINPLGGESWRPVGSASIAYDAVASGDIQHTGSADIVFRNTFTGDWGFMSTNRFSQVWHPIGATSAAYSVVGSGDFNGDGVFDVAFENGATGDWGFMSVSPTGGESWHPVGNASTAYDAVASADFLGTGQTEIAFRNRATGDWGFMQANVSGGETWHPIGASGVNYLVIGNGDFNGDGVQDVAFRNTSTGDWGFMSVNPGGGELWHQVGSASLAYYTI